MSTIIQLVTFFQDQWAVLVGIFGMSLGGMKFWLRDAESESIRTRFMEVWDYLDDAKRYNFHQLRTHRVVKQILMTCAIIMLFIVNLASVPTEIYNQLLDSPLYFLAFSLILLIFIAPTFCVYYSIRPRMKAYVDAALSQKYTIDTIARLMLPPLFLISMELCSFFNTQILNLYLLNFGYLFSMGFVIVVFMLIYLPIKLVISFLERLFIRLIEIKDGPIYSLAALCAVVGFSVKIVFD